MLNGTILNATGSTLEINSGKYQDDVNYVPTGGLTTYAISSSGVCNIVNADIEGVTSNNGGIMNIYNGNFGVEIKGSLSNSNNGIMNIYNASIGNEKRGSINNTANLNIYNCKYCYQITANNGTTHLYGGKIGTIQYNNVIIEGGTVEYIYQPKTADIKGGTLTGRNNVALRLWQGTANISGGIFEANAFDGAGTWNVTGGKFKLKPSTARISEGYKCVGPDENGYYEVVKE